MDLKETEEVREYLKNLGIEYRYSCYSEKSPTGCHLLGEYLTTITQEFDKANKVYRMNCDDRNHPNSCTRLAQNWLARKGKAKDANEMLHYFTKACDLNDATGCDYAGKILIGYEPQFRKLITINPEKGLEYLTKGCNLGNPTNSFESSESCYAAAFAKAAGVNKLAIDLPAAFKLAEKGCGFAHMESCKLAAEIADKQNMTKEASNYRKQYLYLKKQQESNYELEMQRT